MKEPGKKSSKKLPWLLLALILLIGAGGAGVGIYLGLYAGGGDGAVNTEQSATNTQTNNSSSNNTENYLVISEWNIKLKDPESRMSYKIGRPYGYDMVQLTTKELKELPDGSESCPEWPYLGTIARGTSAPTNETDFYSSSEYVQIGNYYYYYSAGNGLCLQTPSRESDIEGDSRAYLIDNLRTLQAE